MEGDKYAEFSEGLRRYAELYERGLKKQANAYIADFVQNFEKSGTEAEREALLFRFCRDICDGGGLAELAERGNGLMPHALARIVWEYLIKECAVHKMPQMRYISFFAVIRRSSRRAASPIFTRFSKKPTKAPNATRRRRSCGCASCCAASTTARTSFPKSA